MRYIIAGTDNTSGRFAKSRFYDSLPKAVRIAEICFNDYTIYECKPVYSVEEGVVI